MEKLVQNLRDWMFGAALPHWAEVGIDRRFGGSFESLTLDGRGPSGETFKRVRVVGRQLYVFSHAQMLGWREAGTVADHLYEYLRGTCWQGAKAGWPRTLHHETGDVLDGTPDLYDYAFALFALGWRHKATGDSDAITMAHETLDIIDTRFRHTAGGFHHELPAALPRQQNPHMHMTEAALVLAESSGDARFLDLANELASLFETKIARAPSGVLPEFFNDDWTVADGEAGRWVEPGHQFEWAWILARHQELSGVDHTSAVRALVGRAERYGVDQTTQVTRNGVSDEGFVLDRGSRVWPNTERIKGWIGLSEVSGEAPWAAIEGSVSALFERYIGSTAPEGCWIEAYDADGRPTYDRIPASSFYHLFLAFSEVLRIAERGDAQPKQSGA